MIINVHVSFGKNKNGIPSIRRVPFILFGLIQGGISLTALAFAKDPPRGSADEALQGVHYGERMTLRKIRQVCAIPTNVLIIAQGFPANLPWGVLLVYANDYLAVNQVRAQYRRLIDIYICVLHTSCLSKQSKASRPVTLSSTFRLAKGALHSSPLERFRSNSTFHPSTRTE